MCPLTRKGSEKENKKRSVRALCDALPRAKCYSFFL